ncbi:MAG: hypothetical protein Fur0015_03550 [Ignavibacteriales bacterium]
MKKIIFILLFITSLDFAQIATLKPTLELKKINGITVPFQNGLPLPSFEKQKRTIIDLKGEWKKYRFTSTPDLSLSERTGEIIQTLEADNFQRPEFDDAIWEIKNIPSVENEMHEFPTVPERYDNGVWYRYKFSVNDSLSSNFAKLNFIASNYVTDVWLNGNYLGYHEGGYTPFTFDVTDKLIFNAENVIVVRVDNIKWGTRKDIVPFIVSDWFNYAGIIHDVYLEFSAKANIVRTDAVPVDLDGNINLKTVIFNKSAEDKNLRLVQKIYLANIDSNNIQSEFSADLIGSPAAFSGNSVIDFSVQKDSILVLSNSLQISNPLIWSMKEPNLYILKSQLIENGNIIDEFTTQFGVRTIETQKDKVLLNGNVVFLTGAARHEDHPVYGRSIPKEIIYSDFKTIKESNILYVRTAHYPNHPYTYLITDRLGLAVMEEIPVWWFNTAESWQIQNEQRHIHQQMFREMVFKDFNRPSIFFWSTSNECKDIDGRLAFHENIMNDIHTNYADGRLITQSAAGDIPGSADPTQAPLDIAGWTLYFGIFHGGTYYNGTLAFLAQAKTAFPGKPVMDTEFGYWSSENGSSLNQQVTVFDETFKAFKYFAPISSNGNYNPNGHLVGTTWWCVFDWYTYHQTTGYQTMGLISMDRKTRKPVYDKLVAGYEPWAKIGGMIVSVNENQKNIPNDFELYQNYPNPFNPETKIDYSLKEESQVKFELFNLLGEKVKKIYEGKMRAGLNSLQLRSDNLSSGIYFLMMSGISNSGNEFNSSIKMVMIK